MALDTCYEQLVYIHIRVLYEVGWCLFCRYGDERNTLISRLEPDNFRSINRASRFITTVTLSLTTLCLLLLLGSGRRRAQETQSTREQLAWHALDHSNDVAGELRFDLISNPVKMLSGTGC